MISDDLKGAVVGFVVLLNKGLLEDGRWDWDVEKADWTSYQLGFMEPGILRTTMSVFLNNLQMADGTVLNYYDARFRGFQYFRSMIDKSYVMTFTREEMMEPDWWKWEA